MLKQHFLVADSEDPSMLSGAQFKAALKALGHTQTSFSQKYGFGKRTVATWADQGTPQYVFALITDLFQMRVAQAPSIFQPDRSTSDVDKAFAQIFATVARQGERAGWTPEEIASAANRYFENYAAINRDRQTLIEPELPMPLRA